MKEEPKDKEEEKEEPRSFVVAVFLPFDGKGKGSAKKRRAAMRKKGKRRRRRSKKPFSLTPPYDH